MSRRYQTLTREDVVLLLQDGKSKGKPPNLSRKAMAGLDLSGLDFTSPFYDENGHNALLLGADFRNAKLTGCRFSGTDLAGANLRGTDLTNAGMVNANLYSACLKGANMSGTDLRQANLISAELHEVTLDGANLEGAHFGSTSISVVDLSKARGLDQVRHFRPSPMDSDTLRLTANGLADEPETKRLEVLRFLSGSGLDDELLGVFRTWISNPIEFYSCFISYSSKDQKFADKLYADLQENAVRCWFAPHDLRTGDKIRPRIDESIRLHDKLLLILSKYSVASDWVEQEVETAFDRERKEKRTVLFPIRLDDTVMRIETGWPALIKNTRNVGDFRKWRNPEAYRKAFAKILRDLEAEGGQAPDA